MAVPDIAFEAIEGDDKKICSEYKKKIKYQRGATTWIILWRRSRL